MTLDLEALRNTLSYDGETGEFRWLVNRPSHGGKAKVGERAGIINTYTGYRYIGVFGKRYKAARLAWFYVQGHWPAHMIDHKNGVRDDDRIANLREATNAQNQCNRRATAKSGYKGIHKVYRRWSAEIKVNGKKHYLGLFKTIEEAVAARAEAATRLHGEFARAA